MQRLRTNPLPNKLTEFRSIGNSFPAAFTARAQMLSQMHGYPTPAHVIANVWRYLDLSSVNDLKEKLLILRDCALYASDALSSLKLIRTEKFSLQLAEVAEYVTAHAVDYGYDKLTAQDLNLVAYLMVSSEAQDTAWMLDLSSESGDNTLSRFLKLYESVCGPVTVPLPKYAKGESRDKQITFSEDFIATQSRYFVPSRNEIAPITNIVTPPGILRSISSELASLTTEEAISDKLDQIQRQVDNEVKLFALSDIRLLDHVFMLMTNTGIWDIFVTPRTKPDPSQNIERANGLRLFAGYIQALLVYPHMLRYELFKQGYENLEAWHGSFPNIPSDVKANYEQYVRSFDFLDAAADARSMYALYKVAKDPNLDSEIFVQFLEMTTLFGIDDILTGSGINEPEVTVIGLDKLSELDSPANDALLLSFPMRRFPILDDIQVRMLERARFSAISNQMFATITPGSNKFFSDPFVAKLHALNARVPFDWHAHIPASFSFDRAAIGDITFGKYPMRYLAPWATAANQYALRTDEIYKIFNAKKLAGDYPWLMSIDLDIAEKHRKSLNRQWRSLYPANITEGDRLHDIRSLVASDIEIERLLEYMTGEPFAMVRKALLNEPLAEIWATFLSSFALLYRRSSKMSAGVLIPGKGMPYGLTYTQLADKQDFDKDKDFVPIPKTDMFLAFLKVIPTPSTDLAVGDFHLQIPYYYFPGNGGSLEVSKLTSGDGLLHFGLRPVLTLPADRMMLFDKLSVYKNDTLVLQVSNRASYKTDLSADEYFTADLKKEDWKGDKSTSQIHFISPGSYGKAASTPESVPTPDSTAAEVQQLATEMENEVNRVENESSINKLEDHAKNEALDERKIADQINDNPGGKTNPDAIMSASDEKKKKKDVKSDVDPKSK